MLLQEPRVDKPKPYSWLNSALSRDSGSGSGSLAPLCYVTFTFQSHKLKSDLWAVPPSVNGSGSEQNLMRLPVFIPPEGLDLHLTVFSRAESTYNNFKEKSSLLADGLVCIWSSYINFNIEFYHLQLMEAVKGKWQCKVLWTSPLCLIRRMIKVVQQERYSCI